MKSYVFLSVVTVTIALEAISTVHAATWDMKRLHESAASMCAVPAISESEEIALGREIAGRVLGAAPLIGDDAVQNYVNAVGRWVASQSERADLAWHFGVIDAIEFNAYAAPGGYVFITRALYDALDDEAQFAGVLGHAIASIVRRHHVTLLQKHGRLSAMTSAMNEVMALRQNPLLRYANSSMPEMLARGLDQAAVLEADHMAVVLAARAGYSPEAFLEVLQKLHARRGGGSSLADVLFSSHPLPRERVKKLYETMTASDQTLPGGQRPKLRRSVDTSNVTQPNAERHTPEP